MPIPDDLHHAAAPGTLARESVDLVAGLGAVAVRARARIIVALVDLGVGVPETDRNVALKLILEADSLSGNRGNGSVFCEWGIAEMGSVFL